MLVSAAAGGIGSLLVQAARREGAAVVGAARGAAKTDAVRLLGADVAVGYGEPGWEKRVRGWADGQGRRISLGLDGVGGTIGRAVFELLAPGGRVVPASQARAGWG